MSDASFQELFATITLFLTCSSGFIFLNDKLIFKDRELRKVDDGTFFYQEIGLIYI